MTVQTDILRSFFVSLLSFLNPPRGLRQGPRPLLFLMFNSRLPLLSTAVSMRVATGGLSQ